MPAEKFDFPNAQGQKLAALLDRPDGPVRAVALFAHCFTCGKSIRAARHIADGLKLHGIAVLRFDFTGLGASEGEFANTTFPRTSTISSPPPIICARKLAAPALLIGHSLGGAAVLAAAHRIAEARAVVTIAAPFDPAHVIGLFGEQTRREIGDKDEVEVTIAGRPFKVRRSLLEDVKQQNLAERVGAICIRRCWSFIRRPTIRSASTMPAIFFWRRNIPKASSRWPAPIICSAAQSDAVYVAHVIAAWADRYLDMAVDDADWTETRKPGVVTVRETRRGKFQQEIIAADIACWPTSR